MEWRVIGLKGKDDRNRNVRIGCRILRRLSTEKIATWGLLSLVRKVGMVLSELVGPINQYCCQLHCPTVSFGNCKCLGITLLYLL